MDVTIGASGLRSSCPSMARNTSLAFVASTASARAVSAAARFASRSRSRTRSSCPERSSASPSCVSSRTPDGSMWGGFP